MPTWGSLSFQNGVSFVIEHLIFFHDHVIVVIVIVIIIVGYILINSCVNKFYNLKLFQGQELERIWTVIPAVFLLFIAFPSLQLLYLIEERESFDITIRVIGHQWYWSYEYRDIGFKSFDSYILSDDNRIYRLLNVDNSLIIPFNTNVRIVISRIDVIHSWTIPSVGIKADAIPGRLNQLILIFNRIGLFSGQCSEICGANHRFIPILITIIPRIEFLIKWI